MNRFIKLLPLFFLLSLISFNVDGQRRSTGTAVHNVASPKHYNAEVWIDAEDYPVGTFADNDPITNKGTLAVTFVVEGSTLAIQVNGDGKKEFVFDGSSWIRCNSGNNLFNNYKNGTSHYAIHFLGTIGTTSNPDAAYGICGNNAAASANEGVCIFSDNRSATAANTRGIRKFTTKGVPGSLVLNSTFQNGEYDVKRSLYNRFDISTILDQDWLYVDGDIASIQDRVRTTANTTSGLGTAVAHSASNGTYNFEIGAVGNGTFPMVGEMEQFVMYNGELIPEVAVRSIDAFFGYHWTRGDTPFKGFATMEVVADDYVLGGTISQKADRSKTIFVTSVGPNHFTSGSDREGGQIISTDNGFSWPTSYTTVFSDGSNATHNPAGGYTQSGRLGVMYGRYSATTGTYNGLIAQYSDDDGTTWSGEISLTVPTTSPALTYYISHDDVIHCNNGDVGVIVYAASGTSLYKIYFVRSTDDWETFSFTEIYSSVSASINETSVAWLGGNNWLVMSRIEAAIGGFYEYKQFISTDDLATFSDQGNTNDDLNYVFAHPPQLRSILIDGTRVIEMSWVNRGSRRRHLRYATAAGIIANGVSEWTGKTIYHQPNRAPGATAGGWRSGYPFTIHQYNDLNEIGVWFSEESTSATNARFFKSNDEIKVAIKSELGL